MSGYDGPALRSLRESTGVALRRVARQSGMSHGHLSKVERGETGRPVTPAVLAAYEKATGVRLADATWPDGDARFGWRRGQLGDARRRGFNARVASVAVGGPLAEPITRMMEAVGRTTALERLQAGDVTQLHLAGQLCTATDLRFGGGVADPLARTLLRWGVGLLAPPADDQNDGVGVYGAVGVLAQRAAWAAFDADAHEAARAMFTVALYAATQADDADLRAHVLADLAAQHNHLGYTQDCLHLVRLGEVDERISLAVRMVLHAVKARAYAAVGDAAGCRRQVDLAEQAQADAEPEPGWQETICTPGRLHAGVGHAMAILARRTGDSAARAEATWRLTHALDALDPTIQARSAALCTTRLTAVYLDAGELDTAACWGHRGVQAATGIRSTRLSRHLHAIRAAVADLDTAVMTDLVTAIDAATDPAPGRNNPPDHAATETTTETRPSGRPPSNR